MKKAFWVLWIYALLFNGYATWMWGSGIAQRGLPRSLDLQSYAIIVGPAISFVALLWSSRRRSPGQVLSKG